MSNLISAVPGRTFERLVDCAMAELKNVKTFEKGAVWLRGLV